MEVADIGKPLHALRSPWPRSGGPRVGEEGAAALASGEVPPLLLQLGAVVHCSCIPRLTLPVSYELTSTMPRAGGEGPKWLLVVIVGRACAVEMQNPPDNLRSLAAVRSSSTPAAVATPPPGSRRSGATPPAATTAPFRGESSYQLLVDICETAARCDHPFPKCFCRAVASRLSSWPNFEMATATSQASA